MMKQTLKKQLLGGILFLASLTLTAQEILPSEQTFYQMQRQPTSDNSFAPDRTIARGFADDDLVTEEPGMNLPIGDGGLLLLGWVLLYGVCLYGYKSRSKKNSAS